MSATPLLDRVRIARPCDAGWDGMQGDDRVRFCSLCGLTVTNLSGMRSEEAEAFLRERVGRRSCLHLYRRRDGTVLTRDCPRGLRDRAAWLQVAAAALLSATMVGAGIDAARGGPTATQVLPAVGRALDALPAVPGLRSLKGLVQRFVDESSPVDGAMDEL